VTDYFNCGNLIFVIVHVALEIYADIRDNVFRKKEEPHDNEKPLEYQRFNLTLRIQHVILMVTFLLLAFTGGH
jgi:Ni,Fe-hydrogenase I cytochrome b subunit